MPGISRRSFLSAGGAVCASTLFVHPSLAYSAPDAQQTLQAEFAPSSPRERLLLDRGWRFTYGNANDPSKDLDFGVGSNQFEKTGYFSFSRPEFDDSDWRSVNLPHDWAVELPFVHDDTLMSHGYKPLGRLYPGTSVGYYRRAFDIPESDRGRRIVVEFDGVNKNTLLFVNGCFIGRSTSGYVPFEFDLTDFLHYGETNYIALRVDAALDEGWFYEGAGIYRHAWLTKTSPIHLGSWESTIRSELKGQSAKLALGTVVENKENKDVLIRVTWKVHDASGKLLATAQTLPASIPAGGSTPFHTKATLDNPQLWSVDSPNLYSAIVSVESGGAVLDAERIAFGVRSAVFDANKGLFLNGKHLKIQGTCNHQDHAGVGVALPDRLQYYRLSVLKEMGGNAIRTAHNMPTPEWIEACDRMGMLVMCETRQMSANPEAIEQLETMVKRYRNSPSILIWSIGNEEDRLQTVEAAMGQRIASTMVRRCHELDPTRPVSAAVNGKNDKGVSVTLDVIGFNYHYDYPDAFHKKYPERPVYGSETAEVYGTRGVYFPETGSHTVEAYDYGSVVGRHGGAEVWWPFYAEREWEAGGFAWTGFDYRGEPTPFSWPSISSQYGIVDTCGFPKDTFYYYRAWWGAEPVLHLFPHWNFKGKEGQSIPVWVHSNLEEVELFLNGRSLGKQKVPHLGHVEWKAVYEPGSIEVHGFRNSEIVLSAKKETTGPAVSIRLTADRTEIAADGEDLSIIAVEVVDAHGRAVPTAGNTIKFIVDGDGAFLGVGNGNPNCLESDKEPRRSLFNGLAQVIVQSTPKPGTIRIIATRDGDDGPSLRPATLLIRTRETQVRPAVPVVSE